MDLKQRILVFVPHSDDETLLTGGILARAAADGREALVVIATNGDYGAANHDLAHTRIRESLAAMAFLGIPAERVLFLGYGDTGMEPADSMLYRLYHSADPGAVTPSPCSRETYGIPGEKEDYHFTRFGAHAPYTRRSFWQDTTTILRDFLPEQIFTTSRYDYHGDHIATCLFLIEAIRAVRCEQPDFAPALYEGIVHSLAGDLAWPLPQAGQSLDSYTPPPGLEAQSPLKWARRVSFLVPAAMQTLPLAQNQKYRALLMYETQTVQKANEEGVVEYLLSFAKKEEIFWRVPL